LFVVTAKFSGRLKELQESRTGSLLQRGQSLSTIYFPQLVSSREEYLPALVNLKSLQASQFW
jgi:hypothetical protein